MVEIRMLGPADLGMLLDVRAGLFDNPVRPEQARAFLSDPHHHIAVAIVDGQAVSFASGTVMLHPDKAPAFFVNEVGTRDEFTRRGLATQVTQALMDHARALGCEGIWLGTEPENAPALALYRRLEGTEEPFIGFAWDGAFDAD